MVWCNQIIVSSSLSIEMERDMFTMNEILDIAASFVEVLLCCIFVSSFMEEKKQGKMTLAYLIAGGYLLFNLITMRWQVYSVFRGVVFVCSMVCMNFAVYRRYYDKIIVMTITYFLLLTLIDYSVVALMTYFSDTTFRYFQEMTIFRLYGVIFSKSLLAVFSFFIHKKLTSLKKLRKHHLIIILFVSGCMLLFALYTFQNFMERNRIFGTEVAIFILLLFIEMLIFYSFSSMAKEYEKEEMIGFLNLYNRMLKDSLENEKKSFELWTKKIHDYKHHVIYMRELVEKEDYETLKKLMEEETGILDKQFHYIGSGYMGIDAIINSKIAHAQNLGIHVFCNVAIPKGLSVDENVIVSILGNLLDNAIRAEEACPEKNIELCINAMKGNLYIKVVNHKGEGKISFHTSDKKEARWHGIGLKSVRWQVDRLQGDFQMLQKEKQVAAIVVLYDAMTV